MYQDRINISDEDNCRRCNLGGRVVPDPDVGTAVKYEVQHNELLGRHLIASENIAAGEIVFRAQPLVTGLQAGCAPLCLGCYGPLPQVDDALDLKCPMCGWFLCSEECIYSLRHQVCVTFY
jgi:hypothetical protein